MKKLLSILAATMMLTTSVCAQEISLKINNEIIEPEVKPVQEEGTTLVPLRIVGEYLGAQIEWNQQTQTVTIVKDNKILELTIGSKVVKVNGVEQSLQCAPKLINGTTMVPIRLVSENLGSTVVWEEETGTVVIQSKQSDVANTETKEEYGFTGEVTYEIIYPDGVYTGEFIRIDGKPVPHGKGIYSSNDGNVFLEGIFANGKVYEGTESYTIVQEGIKYTLFIKDSIVQYVEFYDLDGNIVLEMTGEEYYKEMEKR